MDEFISLSLDPIHVSWGVAANKIREPPSCASQSDHWWGAGMEAEELGLKEALCCGIWPSQVVSSLVPPACLYICLFHCIFCDFSCEVLLHFSRLHSDEPQCTSENMYGFYGYM